ncbi:MAG: DNA polymerase III subunit beta [Litorivicinaceae bacterium]
MEFSVSREQLLEKGLTAASVVERKQTMAILANVLIEVDATGAVVTGTDLDTEISTHMELVEVASGGAVTVPGKKLVDIAKALPEGSVVQFKQDGTQMMLSSGRSRFKLGSLPSTDYPRLEIRGDFTTVTLAKGPLQDAIAKTQFAMAQQDVRYYLNGMLFAIGGGEFRTVATDGHRLSLYQTPLEGLTSEPASLIVPRKAVLELARLAVSADDSVEVSFSTSHFRVAGPTFTFTSVLIDGRFPDYERVVPQGGDHVVRADRKRLREVLVRAAILSSEQYRGVRLCLSQGQIDVMANNAEQEEAQESLEAEFVGQDGFEIGFNVSYLLDVLATIETEMVELRFGDSNRSALVLGVGDDAARYVVMPMRL